MNSNSFEAGKPEGDRTPIAQAVLALTGSLSASEIAVGSLVHAFKVPFGGHLLSLNQGVILTWCLKRAESRREAAGAVNSISLTSGALKAFSPMGNRLGPMLAISTQGFLYSAGILLLGTRFAGAMLGMVLLSLWGFLQPVLVAAILFGKSFFIGLLKVWGDIAQFLGLSEEILWPVLATVVIIKLVLACVLAVLALRMGVRGEEAYVLRLKAAVERTGFSVHSRKEQVGESHGRGVVRDLLNPWFLAGALISFGFFLGTGEAGAPELAFLFLRIFGVSVLIFWGLRALPESAFLKGLVRIPGVRRLVEQVRSVRESGDPR